MTQKKHLNVFKCLFRHLFPIKNIRTSLTIIPRECNMFTVDLSQCKKITFSFVTCRFLLPMLHLFQKTVVVALVT